MEDKFDTYYVAIADLQRLKVVTSLIGDCLDPEIRRLGAPLCGHLDAAFEKVQKLAEELRRGGDELRTDRT